MDITRNVHETFETNIQSIFKLDFSGWWHSRHVGWSFYEWQPYAQSASTRTAYAIVANFFHWIVQFSWLYITLLFKAIVDSLKYQQVHLAGILSWYRMSCLLKQDICKGLYFLMFKSLLWDTWVRRYLICIWNPLYFEIRTYLESNFST